MVPEIITGVPKDSPGALNRKKPSLNRVKRTEFYVSDSVQLC